MTRMKISAGILVVLVILSILTGFWITKKCNYMIDEIEQIMLYADDNNKKSAELAAENLSESWEKFCKQSHIIVKSDKLSDIDRINSRIIHLIKNDSDELESELNEMKSMIKFLKESESDIFASVF